MVRERDFVFITDGPLLEHIVNKPPCDLKIGRYNIVIVLLNAANKINSLIEWM